MVVQVNLTEPLMHVSRMSERLPHLVQALEALAQRADNQEAAKELLHELSDITVLVARRFTTDKTADGLLEAFYLTIGCISLGISQADLSADNASKLSFLLHHGAEHVFQMGFRHIKELSSLPFAAFISDFDRDPFMQQRNIKALFVEICRADPLSTWAGDDTYNNELLTRRNNQKIIACARLLRSKHYAGPVRDADMDANAVIAIAVIFAILNDGRIVARTGQRELENLIRSTRKTLPDIEAGWNALLKKSPPEFQPVLRERMDEYRNTIIKKILSSASVKSVITALQQYYTGDELEIEYS